jgi:hypothetical protein
MDLLRPAWALLPSLAIFVAACSSPGPAVSRGSSAVDQTSGTGDAGGSNGGANEAGAGVPACSWPANLDDGGAGWSVSRAWLKCAYGPDTELCSSDNLTTCPPSNAVAGGTATACVDQCATNEYAVGVGGPPYLLPDGAMGVRPSPDLPSTCHSVGALPAGVEYYCCPCE